MSRPGNKTDWLRALPCLVAGWLYVPVVLLVIRLVDAHTYENVFALLAMAAGALLFAPLWANWKGWLSDRAITLLYYLPYGIGGLLFVGLVD